MTRQGKIIGMPAAEYHAGPEISNSLLKQFIDKSPLHFHLAKNGKIKHETKSTAFGTDAHCLILEPERFTKEYAIGPQVKTRASKEWKEFAAENKDKRLLKPSEYDHLCEIKERVRMSGKATRWLIDAPGETEVSYFWTDPESGLSCRCRADKIICTSDKIICVDLKSCQDASRERFYWNCRKYGYIRAAYWYTNVIQMVTGKRVLFVALAVESVSLVAAAYTFGQNLIQEASFEVQEALIQIQECEAEGFWPGYFNEIEELT